MIFRITSVIARPMIGSAIGAPSATTTALATTPSETNPSIARVVAVRDQRRADASRRPAAEPHLGGELVADEADHARSGERPRGARGAAGG